MRFPDLVIGGAPKCGTSSLFGWLSAHPNICPSSVKEPFFLMDSDYPLAKNHPTVHRNGLPAYCSYFQPARAQSLCMEATTHYLYQRTALDVLADLVSVPRLVFILRRPEERVYSSFQFGKNNVARIDPNWSFSEYVEAVLTSDFGAVRKRIRSEESAFVLANEIKYSEYVRYLPAWLDRLGKKRVRILVFEELRRSPRETMKELAAFIGIDPGFYDNFAFQRENETVPLKSPALHRYIRELARLLPHNNVLRKLKPIYYHAQAGARRLHRTENDLAALTRLRDHFRPMNTRLASECQLDLRLWDSYEHSSAVTVHS